MSNYMLTTIDNPFNPHNDWDNWLAFDHEKQHNTCELLARLSFTSDGLPDSINDEIISNVIDDIILNDQLGIYMKVKKDDIIRAIPIKI